MVYSVAWITNPEELCFVKDFLESEEAQPLILAALANSDCLGPWEDDICFIAGYVTGTYKALKGVQPTWTTYQVTQEIWYYVKEKRDEQA